MSRWLLLKLLDNQSKKQAVKLCEQWQYNLKNMRGHLIKEEFQTFWTCAYPAWSGKCLDALV